MATQYNKLENVFWNKNDFDKNQKYFQVFQAFCLLKNRQETSGETQKTWLKSSSFCFVFSRFTKALIFLLSLLSKHVMW